MRTGTFPMQRRIDLGRRNPRPVRVSARSGRIDSRMCTGTCNHKHRRVSAASVGAGRHQSPAPRRASQRPRRHLRVNRCAESVQCGFDPYSGAAGLAPASPPPNTMDNNTRAEAQGNTRRCCWSPRSAISWLAARFPISLIRRVSPWMLVISHRLCRVCRIPAAAHERARDHAPWPGRSPRGGLLRRPPRCIRPSLHRVRVAADDPVHRYRTLRGYRRRRRARSRTAGCGNGWGGAPSGAGVVRPSLKQAVAPCG